MYEKNIINNQEIILKKKIINQLVPIRITQANRSFFPNTNKKILLHLIYYHDFEACNLLSYIFDLFYLKEDNDYQAILIIKYTNNNNFYTLLSKEGKFLKYFSSNVEGLFKKSKKKSFTASQILFKNVVNILIELQLFKIKIIIRHKPNIFIKSKFISLEKNLNLHNIFITSLDYKRPFAFNGTRLKKKKR